eukprot:TRINITY_DN2349_c0_g1_i3.p1 TRINITY_DN2349_c0_g1~~TRINITY_DN2349_c0_g1_i3.p1  ORF type:complete len:126 (-),score=24.49 TRINITY_DN2349_c0_g1_i3:401-778(-)
MIKACDTDGGGKVNYDSFLVFLRGGLNDNRRQWVEKAFAVMDADGSGVITTADIAAKYNAHFHPKFKSGEWTEEQVFEEFLKHLDVKDGDGKISKEEFLSYYGDMSASVDTDEYWEEMMKSAWKF